MKFCIILCCIFVAVSASYWTTRNEVIEEEALRAVGSSINLNEDEEKVNNFLMNLKKDEMEYGFKHPEKFPPAIHFFQAKEDINNSSVFQFIRKMPKGGALHLHDTASASIDYVFRNITFRDHLYVCEKDEDFKLIFANPPPEDDCWKSVEMVRQEPHGEDFDFLLRNKMTLVVDNPTEAYPDINTVWIAFEKIFDLVTPMLTYRPVFLEYFYHGLQELYWDNINYVEVRGGLTEVYDLNGKTYDSAEVLGMLKDVADQFLRDHPDFLGVKYIYAPQRGVDNNTMQCYLELYEKMQKLYPDFLIGFDLVGQEDLGQPLTSFITQLQEMSTQFFFHSGETNWNGMSTDMNLVDAVLLNTTRIGHGYALLKHPLVMEMVKKRGIGVEVNPLSNQVLNLVKDLRNHPASVLLANDYPVVISSDAPSFWESDGLSHDFYETFMGIASANADLRMLKQLCLNSLIYSGLSIEDKQIAIDRWEELWNKFINSMVQQLSN